MKATVKKICATLLSLCVLISATGTVFAAEDVPSDQEATITLVRTEGGDFHGTVPVRGVDFGGTLAVDMKYNSSTEAFSVTWAVVTFGDVVVYDVSGDLEVTETDGDDTFFNWPIRGVVGITPGFSIPTDVKYVTATISDITYSTSKGEYESIFDSVSNFEITRPVS